jgi:hypothetical protein
VKVSSALVWFCGSVAAGAIVVACATAGGVAGPAKVEATCERGVCARIVARIFTTDIDVEISAPAGVALHNAWIVDSAGPACRGGRSLNAVGTDAGARINGPLPLEPEQQLKLTFALRLTSGRFLDLDVRGPDGPICLRLPVEPSPASDAGVAAEAGGG